MKLLRSQSKNLFQGFFQDNYLFDVVTELDYCSCYHYYHLSLILRYTISK